jgi:hypothetical protein
MQYGYQNYKSCKKTHEKKVINEKVKNWVFYFYYCVQKFLASNFFGRFFQRIQTALNFAF